MSLFVPQEFDGSSSLPSSVKGLDRPRQRQIGRMACPCPPWPVLSAMICEPAPSPTSDAGNHQILPMATNHLSFTQITPVCRQITGAGRPVAAIHFLQLRVFHAPYLAAVPHKDVRRCQEDITRRHDSVSPYHAGAVAPKGTSWGSSFTTQKRR